MQRPFWVGANQISLSSSSGRHPSSSPSSTCSRRSSSSPSSTCSRKEMEFVASEANAGKGEGKCEWTPTQSAFMLNFLANVVANGIKTASRFKKVHLNSCARALNEHFKLRRTEDQVANHLKTWKMKYIKMNTLRNLSAALWDEDKFIISLNHDHYTDYITDHKADDEYLNKPLEHYGEMATIFGNSVATEKYAKGSNVALATEVEDNDKGQEELENGATATVDDNGASSSATKPSKRAKIVESDEEGLIGAFKAIGEMIVTAIEKAAKGDNELPPGLFDNVVSLPGFDGTHKSFYYDHLVEKPHKARAFNALPFDYKLSWLAKFISETFPGC